MNAVAFAALLWAWIFGALIVAALWPRARPLRPDIWLIAPVAALVGMAATSLTFFLASLVTTHAALFAFAAELAVGGLLVPRLRGHVSGVTSAAACATRDGGVLWFACLAVPAAVMAGVLAVRSYQAEPYGGWDAWAIWNLHARVMLRAGPDWTRLQHAPQLSWTHPDYPRLVPASVARAWSWTGAEAPDVSALVSGVFAAATVALLVAAVARVRGRLPALVGGALLVTTPFFITFAANEHADIPLGALMLAAVVLATIARREFRALAALCAAFAAWTKNEGLLFALVFALAWTVTAWRLGERKSIPGFFGALALGLVPVFGFKLFLAPPSDLAAGSLAGRLAQLWDGSRHALIAASLWRDVGHFGEWSIPPYFAMALPFLAWKTRRPLGANAQIISGVVGLMLAGYYMVYLLSPQDLAWHLDSSLVRLLLQLWPMALLAWCLTVPCAEWSIARPSSKRIVVGAVAASVALAAVGLFALSRQIATNELAFVRGVAAVPDEGWFGIERLNDTTWVWSQGNATLQLHVSGSRPRENVTLRFSLRSLVPRDIAIRTGERVWWRGSVSEREFVRVELAPLALPPGTTTLQFTTNAPGVPESASPDARALAFAIYDFGIRVR